VDTDDVALHPAIAAVAIAALGDDAGATPRAGTVDGLEQARLLAELLERQGPEGLLAAGRHLDVVAGEPLLLALLNTEAPEVLLDKIARLNRFFHSSHRHRVLEVGPSSMELEHHSLSRPPPTWVESLFVCGLYLALLHRIGCRTISCAFPASPSGAVDVYRDGRPREVPNEGTHRWTIGWATHEPVRPLPGLDELVLRDLPPDLTDRSASARVGAVVDGDLSRAWRLAAVAARLAVSPRTLQRQLRDEGSSFTEVLGRARIRGAQELLLDPTKTVTDVGYVTGFADTAHFTRSFKAAAGCTPTVWRAQQARD
jgi:AraC-like DNA-binding protein